MRVARLRSESSSLSFGKDGVSGGFMTHDHVKHGIPGSLCTPSMYVFRLLSESQNLRYSGGPIEFFMCMTTRCSVLGKQ